MAIRPCRAWIKSITYYTTGLFVRKSVYYFKRDAKYFIYRPFIWRLGYWMSLNTRSWTKKWKVLHWCLQLFTKGCNDWDCPSCRGRRRDRNSARSDKTGPSRAELSSHGRTGRTCCNLPDTRTCRRRSKRRGRPRRFRRRCRSRFPALVRRRRRRSAARRRILRRRRRTRPVPRRGRGWQSWLEPASPEPASSTCGWTSVAALSVPILPRLDQVGWAWTAAAGSVGGPWSFATPSSCWVPRWSSWSS